MSESYDFVLEVLQQNYKRRILNGSFFICFEMQKGKIQKVNLTH